MSKLVIAEKPSVALSVARVIGATKKQDGYYEGNGYVVSWCVGHLVQMANPDSYDEKYAKWKKEDLPIIPKNYLYDVSKHTKKQFMTLKKLMNDKNIKEIVNACDAGREGELIFRLVYEQAKCKKPILRLWISSLEDNAIREGFDTLKDGKEFENLYHSALARAKADWLVGMNLSRLYSILNKENYSVGRVQSPTLAMIVSRDEEIRSFQKEKYYTVEVHLGGFNLSTDRINSLEEAKQVRESIRESITINDVIQKEKITKPDLPFDLTTLQRECNKYFGFSAKQTLDYAQSLYEKKLITYPRTDSRYLTTDMITGMVNNILGKNDFDTNRIKVIFDSSQVTDHHAIVPTISSLQEDIAKLPESEAKVYKLISNKFHASVGYPLIESGTKILAEVDGTEFTNTSKVIVEEGFTKYLREYKTKKKEEVILPNVKGGEALTVDNAEIKEKYTTPPKFYTEDTLLKAMELAGNDALEKGVEVERKGLGTPATRAGVIENLLYKGFVIRDKKNLKATEKGKKLISVIDEAFCLADTTANWEMQLSEIAKGKLTEEAFLKDIEKEIGRIIGKY